MGTNDIKNQDIETDLLVKFFGIRRSGNHAVIYWLLRHQQDHYFFNDSNVPFDARCMLKRLRYAFPFKHKLTIVSWENKPLDKPLYVKTLTASKEKTIIIMRDPFNWLASHMAKRWGTNNQLLTLYMSHLNEFLGETNHLGDKICVNYNRWFADQEYRKEISKQVGFAKFHDSGINNVPSEGGGSSFDGVRLRGSARKMKVLDRWRNFAREEKYQKWIQWPELIEKANLVWPEMCDRYLCHTKQRKNFFL